MTTKALIKPFHKLHTFCTTSFTYLLIALVLLFIFRPFGPQLRYLATWEFFLSIVFLGAVFNCSHPRHVKIWAILVGVPAILIEWISVFYHQDTLIIVGICLTILFLFLCTISLLINEVLHAPPTLGSLRPVLCVYFMFGYAFAYLFLLTEFLNPGSVQLIAKDISALYHGAVLSEIIYWSFGNLTTVGASNIAALGTVSQTLVIIEAIVGQFYIAVLVAKIVTLYASRQMGNAIVAHKRKDHSEK